MANLKISAEDLDRKVDIQLRRPTPSGNGAVTYSWETTRQNVPAKVVQMNGGDFYTAQQVEAQFEYKITIRWIPDMDETNYQIIYQGRVHEITKRPIELGRRQFLECWARYRSS